MPRSRKRREWSGAPILRRACMSRSTPSFVFMSQSTVNVVVCENHNTGYAGNEVLHDVAGCDLHNTPSMLQVPLTTQEHTMLCDIQKLFSWLLALLMYRR